MTEKPAELPPGPFPPDSVPDAVSGRSVALSGRTGGSGPVAERHTLDSVYRVSATGADMMIHVYRADRSERHWTFDLATGGPYPRIDTIARIGSDLHLLRGMPAHEPRPFTFPTGPEYQPIAYVAVPRQARTIHSGDITTEPP